MSDFKDQMDALLGAEPEPLLITRRQYLTMAASNHFTIMGQPVPMELIKEAVASTALEHPEWDMGESKTLSAWEAENV